MYFDTELNIVKQDEQFALGCLCRPDIPEPVLVSCVCSWESCALLVIQNPYSFVIQTAAVKTWYSCAEHVMQTPELEDLLIACTAHEVLAEKLMHHQDPVIRAACTHWKRLAEQLQHDPQPGVAHASRSMLNIKPLT